MLSQQLDLLDGFIQISDQGTSQLHLISETSHAVVISSKQYHGFRSFSSAREVAVLQMHHLLIHFMSQNSQRFSGYLSHACLKLPHRCRSLDHLADVVDMIGCRPLLDHHTYMSHPILRPKPYAHRMYAQDQVVIHTVRM
jgi:hypothetical protein